MYVGIVCAALFVMLGLIFSGAGAWFLFLLLTADEVPPAGLVVAGAVFFVVGVGMLIHGLRLRRKGYGWMQPIPPRR